MIHSYIVRVPNNLLASLWRHAYARRVSPADMVRLALHHFTGMPCTRCTLPPLRDPAPPPPGIIDGYPLAVASDGVDQARLRQIADATRMDVRFYLAWLLQRYLEKLDVEPYRRYDIT